MRIGIIEVSEPNHYSAVNALLKTYTSNQDNQVTVYTLPSIQLALKENGIPQNASIVTLEHKNALSKLLKDIEKIHFDRIHICTIFDNFIEFAHFKPQVDEVYLHIHQCEEWYNDNYQRAITNLILNLKNKDQNRKYYRIIARSVVDFSYYRLLRKKILSDYDSDYKLKLIVHSKGQKETLRRYSCQSEIIIFPFALYEGMDDLSSSNQLLRVCVPGVISQAKRDYLSLFRALQENADRLCDRIYLHLLGYITDREKEEMESAISELASSGYKIYYHKTFVYGKEFDDALENCDLLLNNQFISKNNTEVYGQTKESGMIFNMLRAAKPGLLPQQYNVSPEFHNSTLFFDNYEHLVEIIEELSANPERLNQLKLLAKKLSVCYSPESLYERLIKKI